MKQHWNPDLYNTKHAFVYKYGESLVELLNPGKQERILDLGCGSGQLTAKIGDLAMEVIGLDKSHAMISDAKLKFHHIEFQVGDASDFCFEEKFDAIFSNATLHWVTNYRECIRCMFNNLKSGGRIVVEFGGKGNVQIIVNQLRASLAAYGYPNQSKLQLWHFPSIGEYSSLLEQAGFRVTIAQHYDRPTELSDGNTGIKDWLSMFGEQFFQGIDPEHVDKIKSDVQEKIKPKALLNEKWYADYKRLRIMAIKEE